MLGNGSVLTYIRILGDNRRSGRVVPGGDSTAWSMWRNARQSLRYCDGLLVFTLSYSHYSSTQLSGDYRVPGTAGSGGCKVVGSSNWISPPECSPIHLGISYAHCQEALVFDSSQALQYQSNVCDSALSSRCTLSTARLRVYLRLEIYELFIRFSRFERLSWSSLFHNRCTRLLGHSSLFQIMLIFSICSITPDVVIITSGKN